MRNNFNKTIYYEIKLKEIYIREMHSWTVLVCDDVGIGYFEKSKNKIQRIEGAVKLIQN